MVIPLNLLAVTDSMKPLRVPIVTYAIIALNVIFHFYRITHIDGLPPWEQALYGVIPARVAAELASGHPSLIADAFLTMLMAMFWHSGWWHLIANMLTLFAFGCSLEALMGSTCFAFFYLVCGLAGTLTFVCLAPDSSWMVSSIGASVAIFGLIGGYLVLLPGARMFGFGFLGGLPIPLPFYFRASWVIGAIMLLQFVDVVLGGGIFAHGINGYEHFGGFIAGFAISWAMRERGWLIPTEQAFRLE